MFNIFKWGKEPEDEEFENRIIKKCTKEFMSKKDKPYLKEFEKLKCLGKGKNL